MTISKAKEKTNQLNYERQNFIYDFQSMQNKALNNSIEQCNATYVKYGTIGSDNLRQRKPNLLRVQKFLFFRFQTVQVVM